MRRRPQPSPRRGLLRAVIAAIVLIAVILAILLLVSSLTAQPAKAPTAPPTPTVAPTTPSAQTTPTAGAGITPAPTRSTHKKKDVAVAGRPPGLAHPSRAVQAAPGDAAASPGGRYVAWIRHAGSAYGPNPLDILDRQSGRRVALGSGDRFIRPVWSRDGRRVLFVSVARTGAYPGARWTLMLANRVSGQVQALVRQNALNMLPLGWRGRRPLYLLSTASDTSIFTAVRHRPHFVSIMMPQVITGATLAPGGGNIAFAAPSNCFFCTYDNFDFAAFHTSVGPSGGANEGDMAWAPDVSKLAVPLKDSIGVLSPGAPSPSAVYPRPSGLPRVWGHPMTFTESGRTLTLRDTVTGARYTSTR